MAAVVLAASFICGVSADGPSRKLLGEASHEWDYAGIFELEANKDYFMTLEKNAEGKYSEDEQQLLILPVDISISTNAGLEQASKTATKVWGKDKQEVAPGSQVPLGVWTHMEPDQDIWVTLFKIRTTEDGPHAFFAKHDPKEFENHFHYLRDADGNDV